MFLSSVTGSKYICIGGQHSVYVAKELRKNKLDQGITCPPWLETVVADVLKCTTSVEVREAEAGADQFRQQAVSGLPLSSTLYFFF